MKPVVALVTFGFLSSFSCAQEYQADFNPFPPEPIEGGGDNPFPSEPITGPNGNPFPPEPFGDTAKYTLNEIYPAKDIAGNVKCCPRGLTFDGEDCVIQHIYCRPDQYWNGAQCANREGSDHLCIPGYIYNEAAGHCEKSTCQAGQYWNGIACVNYQKCSPCAPSFIYDDTTKRCENQVSCSVDQYWNGAACVHYQKCSPCAAGYAYSSTTGHCERA